MKKLTLCFLWHMHQPMYQNAITRTTEFPWVLYHALKDYYDMPYLADKYAIKVTFNLTPSLLTQMDEFTHIEAFAARETECLLKHCGNYLRANSPLVDKMLTQVGHYKHEDSDHLKEELASFVGTILPFYQRLWNEKRIDISTTPFYHPIIPLLIDQREAIVPNPNALIPDTTVDYSAEARAQIRMGADYIQHLFSSPPQGFWPSEGSISHKSVEMFLEEGVRWLAADEWLLEGKSHFKPYYVEKDGQNIVLFFRDRDLSDSIGFRYAHLDPADAVDDFIGKLQAIYENNDDPVVTVALDGENAWEFFPDNGLAFFDELYSRLGATEWIETDFLSNVADRVKGEKLEHVNSGSWAGDFSIWIGSRDKNALWEELANVKHALDTAQIDTCTYQEAYAEFMIALGSDWFWWVGTSDPNVPVGGYKKLFKSRLLKIYQLLNATVPESLLNLSDEAVVERFHAGPDFAYPLKELVGEGYSYLNLKYESSVMPFEQMTASVLAYRFLGKRGECVLVGKNLHHITRIKIVRDNGEETLDVSYCSFFGMLKIDIGECRSFRLELYHDNKLLQSVPAYRPIQREQP